MLSAVGPGGFEPPLTDPKSAVLPLDEGPVWGNVHLNDGRVNRVSGGLNLVADRPEHRASGALPVVHREHGAGPLDREDRQAAVAVTVSAATTVPCLRPSIMRASSRSRAER